MYSWPLMQNSISLKDKWEMIRFIITSDRFTNGQKVKEFEQEWSRWLGCKHSLFVSSGSTANSLLISSVKELYGLTNNDKVLLPACTWVTNVSPVIQCGLRPVFCDVNLSDYSFRRSHLEEIAKRHPDIKVVFVTHLLGFSANLEIVKTLFPNAIILEDVCEAHGCLQPDGSKHGSNSVGATFSFYFGHHMTTIEGGMVCTNDERLYALMKAKRSHGLARELPAKDFQLAVDSYPDINSQFLFVTDGYNFRSTEINAVLGLSQLKRLDSFIETRTKNFNRYIEIISNYASDFYIPSYSNRHSSYAFPIVSKDKLVHLKIKKLLKDNGIETRPIVGGNLLRQPFLKNYVMDGGMDKIFVADTLNNNGLYVGNNHFLKRYQIDKLDKIFKEATE